MIEQFNNFPICVNCKYYLPEKTGPMQIVGTCGLTMVNPVTGEFADRASRVKLAAAYRKDSMPCGPAGKFFQPGKKKVKPKSKPVVKEEPKVSTAKVISVDVPDMKEVYTHINPKPLTEQEQEVLSKEEAPKKRRSSRSKQAE